MSKKIPCDVYSRVVGFITPVRLWNKGKKQEWKDRRTYQIKEIPIDTKDAMGRGTGQSA